MFHQGIYSTKQIVDRDDVQRGGLIAAAKTIPGQPHRALCSEVILRGRKHTGHLPMLDFHPRPSAAVEPLIQTVCRHLFGSAVLILESGHSYHALGTEAVSADAYLDLLARSTLFGPIVDRAYVAHQVLERQGSLRLSAASGTHEMPMVVSVVVPYPFGKSRG